MDSPKYDKSSRQTSSVSQKQEHSAENLKAEKKKENADTEIGFIQTVTLLPNIKLLYISITKTASSVTETPIPLLKQLCYLILMKKRIKVGLHKPFMKRLVGRDRVARQSAAELGAPCVDTTID